jgi:hypothetical protein
VWSDSEQNVWLDPQGRLHLAITRTPGGWSCAEVVATRPAVHGEYRWVFSVDPVPHDPCVVLGLFLYENDSREIDFELSRWNDPHHPGAQFVIQPAGADSHHKFHTEGANVLTVSLAWEPARVTGRCWAGEDLSRAPLACWDYRGKKIPPAGKMRIHTNLWIFRGRPAAGMRPHEVEIRSFRFSPGPSSSLRIEEGRPPRGGTR